MRFPQDVPVLTDGVVTLRGHHDDDVPAVQQMCSDPLTQQWTPVPPDFTVQDAHDFITRARACWEQDSEWSFVFTTHDDDGVERFAGSCWLRNLGQGRAEIAYGTHPWARRRGLTDRALRLMLAWAFDVREQRVVSWWADRGNWASRRVAWRLGFSCVGPIEGWMPWRGELRDEWMGTLRWHDPRAPRHPWHVAPVLHGSGLVLRPHHDGDIGAVVEACNDPRSRRWLRLPQPYGPTEAREFLESRSDAMASGGCVHWAVADPSTDALLGVINVFDLSPDRPSRSDGEIGYWSHPSARGRGVMTKACRLVVRHCFVAEDDGGLGLDRVTAYAAVDNAASRHVIEANGFTHYGTQRRGLTLGDGSRSDLACYDLLVEEFAA